MLLRNIVKQLGIGDEATVVIPVTVGFPVELVFVVFVLFKGGAQVDDFDPGVCDRFRDLFKAAGTLLRNVVCGAWFRDMSLRETVRSYILSRCPADRFSVFRNAISGGLSML